MSAEAAKYRRMARRIAEREGIDPDVFERQIGQESNFDPKAGSPAGAKGIAQFMDGTAAAVGLKDPYNPQKALTASARLMASYVKKHGSYEKALRAYNAGEGAIEKSRAYGETNHYVKTILPNGEPRAGARRARPGARTRPSARPGRGGGGASTKTVKLDNPLAAQLGFQADAIRHGAVMKLVNSGGKGDVVEFAQKMGESRQLGELAEANAQLSTDVRIPGRPAEPRPVKRTQAGGTGRARKGGLAALESDTNKLARRLGLPVGSGVRSPEHNAAIGGAKDSDHLDHDDRTARDYPVRGEKGWASYRRIVESHGLKPDKDGFTEGIVMVDGKKVRVQVIYGEQHGHGDHVHTGYRYA